MERMTGIEPAFSAWESVLIDWKRALTCWFSGLQVPGVDHC